MSDNLGPKGPVGPTGATGLHDSGSKMGPTGIQLPDDKKLSKEVLDHEYSSRAMEIGWMGRIFGSSAEKPGNIAGFVIIVSFIIFGAVAIWGADTASLTKKDMLLVVAGFISLTLGFLFGRSTS